ncbi:stage II sporulation protein M [Desulfallas sp. Bu1-1]|jgi:stage II sporulation protein M|uniref:stage II sporulation protein M n=1 Tax=Desulfallas sp. Bu1-1 TaxID=2787620 RepID=UPI0018A1254E|nr:stage II sporulation protein M [Desulfallas sp. Bu1-1]MBF7082065.1 stage II sporulation protein M [Desulfallas sp. Bu1-1]
MGYVHRLWTASLRQSWPLYLIVIIIFSLGILLGSLGVNTLREDQTTELHRYLQSFLAQAAELNVDRTQMVRGALYDNLLTAAIMYILGLTVICLPLMLAFIFIRGFILGFTVGFLTMDRELQGLLVILVSMLPQNLFFIPAMIIGGTASLSFSLLLIKRFFNSQTRVWPAFAAYTLIMAGVLAAFALAALMEAYVTPELTRFVASLTAGW